MNGQDLIFAIGDIHGRSDMLRALLGEIDLYCAGRSYQLVFLGDYVDRGPDSAGVIQLVRDCAQTLDGRVLCLSGNHEQMLLLARDFPAERAFWMQHGGLETLDSFRVKNIAELPDDVVSWIRGLPTFHEDALRYFVHAGVDPAVGLERQTDLERLWIRDAFLARDHDFGKHIVHGHSPVPAAPGSWPVPDERQFRTNIDTGAAFGGTLTAAIFEEDEARPIGFLQVNQHGLAIFRTARRRTASGLRAEAAERAGGSRFPRTVAASVMTLALAGTALGWATLGWKENPPETSAAAAASGGSGSGQAISLREVPMRGGDLAASPQTPALPRLPPEPSSAAAPASALPAPGPAEPSLLASASPAPAEAAPAADALPAPALPAPALPAQDTAAAAPPAPADPVSPDPTGAIAGRTEPLPAHRPEYGALAQTDAPAIASDRPDTSPSIAELVASLKPPPPAAQGQEDGALAADPSGGRREDTSGAGLKPVSDHPTFALPLEGSPALAVADAAVTPGTDPGEPARQALAGTSASAWDTAAAGLPQREPGDVAAAGASPEPTAGGESGPGALAEATPVGQEGSSVLAPAELSPDAAPPSPAHQDVADNMPGSGQGAALAMAVPAAPAGAPPDAPARSGTSEPGQAAAAIPQEPPAGGGTSAALVADAPDQAPALQADGSSRAADEARITRALAALAAAVPETGRLAGLEPPAAGASGPAPAAMATPASQERHGEDVERTIERLASTVPEASGLFGLEQVASGPAVGDQASREAERILGRLASALPQAGPLAGLEPPPARDARPSSPPVAATDNTATIARADADPQFDGAAGEDAAPLPPPRPAAVLPPQEPDRNEDLGADAGVKHPVRIRPGRRAAGLHGPGPARDGGRLAQQQLSTRRNLFSELATMLSLPVRGRPALMSAPKRMARTCQEIRAGLRGWRGRCRPFTTGSITTVWDDERSRDTGGFQNSSSMAVSTAPASSVGLGSGSGFGGPSAGGGVGAGAGGAGAGSGGGSGDGDGGGRGGGGNGNGNGGGHGHSGGRN